MKDGARSEPRESTRLMAAGAGIGALGVVTAAVGAAACPVCVIAAPAFIGVGLYKRWRERSAQAAAHPASTPDAP